MELFIDPTDGRSIASQIYAQLRDAITEGRLAPGDRVTPSRMLARDLGVSRFTVTDAYARLGAEGLIEGRAGGGSVVCATSTRAAVPAAASALAPRPRAAHIEMYAPDPTAEARFDLRPGRVDPALFPTATWRRCMTRALRDPPAAYGDPAGTMQLRTALARWVLHSRGITADPPDIVVTSGAQHAIDLVTRVLVEPGDTVAVEEPGYPPISELLHLNGANVTGVPVDNHGIIVDAIPPSTRLVYVTPSHQYPLGMTLSRPRRLELLRWANTHDAAIVEDDYDTEFRYSARPLEPLQRLDDHGRVIYIGTFSKTLAPSLRLGFAALPPTIAPAVRALRQAIDWCPPAPTQTAMATFINEGHLQRHLRRTRHIYHQRRHLMWNTLTHSLTHRGRALPSDAGLHITVLLDAQITDDELRTHTRANGLRVPPLGTSYRHSTPRCGWVIGFGAIPTPDIPAAVNALTTALDTATRPPR